MISTNECSTESNMHHCQNQCFCTKVFIQWFYHTCTLANTQFNLVDRVIIIIPVTGAISVVPRPAAIELQLVAPCWARVCCSPATRKTNMERIPMDFIISWY